MRVSGRTPCVPRARFPLHSLQCFGSFVNCFSWKKSCSPILLTAIAVPIARACGAVYQKMSDQVVRLCAGGAGHWWFRETARKMRTISMRISVVRCMSVAFLLACVVSAVSANASTTSSAPPRRAGGPYPCPNPVLAIHSFTSLSGRARGP